MGVRDAEDLGGSGDGEGEVDGYVVAFRWVSDSFAWI